MDRMRGTEAVRFTIRSKSWLTNSGLRNWPAFRNIQSSALWGSPSLVTLRRHRARTSIVPSSMSMQRRLVRVFMSSSTGLPPTFCRVLVIESRLVERSRSDHLSPTTSPRRIPVIAVRWSAGQAPCDSSFQEGRQLICGPGTCDLLGGLRAPDVGDVGVEELTPHREVERRSGDHVHFEHGLGSEAGAVASGGRGELVADAVEVLGAQSAEGHVADGWIDVAVDEPRLPVRGRGSEVAALEWQPGVGEELTEVDRTAPCRGGVACSRRWRSAMRSASCRSRPAGWPAAAFVAGKGVESDRQFRDARLKRVARRARRVARASLAKGDGGGRGVGGARKGSSSSGPPRR